ncbi:hypothetical protein Tco_0437392, partial [Tanacetum coccineum]
MLLRKRARFFTPASGFEVEESSAAAAARQAGHTLAHRDKPELQCRYISLIDIIPTTLNHGYDVELADGKIIE